MSVRILLSDEEFLALPEFAGKRELLDGELVEMPPAKRDDHDYLAKLIAQLLIGVLGWSRVWIANGYHLGLRRWLAPDVSVDWPDQKKEKGYPLGSPMLSVEIASPGNSAEQMERKRLLYLEHGAAEVWLIYPETRTMVVSRQGGTMVGIGATEDYACELFSVKITLEYRTPVE